MDDKYKCKKCNCELFTQQEINEQESRSKDDIFYGVTLRSTCDDCIKKHEKEKQEKVRQSVIKTQVRGFKVPVSIKLSDGDLNPKSENVLRLMKFLMPDNNSWCFYLNGDYGTGKTHMAYWVINRAIRAGALIRCSNNVTDFEWFHSRTGIECIESSEIISLYQDEYGKREGNPKGALKPFYDATVLFLDDLGAERDTDDSRRILEDLLCYRHKHCLKTIITANTKLEDIVKRYSGRLTSRFSAGESIVLTGKDRRARG